jgi:hypothetical protein
MGSIVSSMLKDESSPVVDREAHRLFLVGWDVPASCTQFPLPSGVRR